VRPAAISRSVLAAQERWNLQDVHRFRRPLGLPGFVNVGEYR